MTRAAVASLQESDLAARLCRALLERGGVFAAFASFLRWRADLLPADSVIAFRQARENAPLSRLHFSTLLRNELGPLGDTLADRLEPEPCWNSQSRIAFRSQYQGQSIVVQIALEPVSHHEFCEFRAGLRQLPLVSHRGIGSPLVLDQFQEWLHLPDDPHRERRYLEAVAETQANTIVACPRLIPEACGPRVLCWYDIAGDPASSLVAASAPGIAPRLAELVLELACNFGMVDGEPDFDHIILTPEGKLAVCRWTRMLSLPRALRSSALKYLSSVISGDSPLAARLLVRLAAGRHLLQVESALLKQLSTLEPEMKGPLRFPNSVALFEANWRALAKIRPQPALFLDCLHRNLQSLGYVCAETRSGSPEADTIAEAQFAVLGRVVRTRAIELFSGGTAQKWMLGSAMLFLEAFRQMGRLAEDFQEDELPIGLELSQAEVVPANGNRALRSLFPAGILLAIFFACLHWGKSAAAPWSAWLATAAASAFAGLFWVVLRLE